MTKPLNLNSNGDVAEVTLGSANQLWGVDSTGTTMSFTNGGLIGETTNSVSIITPLGGSLASPTPLGLATAAPTVSNVGSTGTSTYSYSIVSKDSTGSNSSVTSVFKQTTSGNGLLSSSNCNSITWDNIATELKAYTYDVYRNQQPSTLSTITLGTSPSAKLVNGTTMYVCNYGSSNVSVINLSTQSVTTTISVGTNPYCMVLVGTNLYVANYGSSNVSVIDTGSNTVTHTVAVGSNPCSFSANSSYVFVGCGGSFYSINTSTFTATSLGGLTFGSPSYVLSSVVTANYIVNVQLTGASGGSINTYTQSPPTASNNGFVFNDNLSRGTYAVCNNPVNDICYAVGGTQFIYAFNAATNSASYINTQAAFLHNCVMSVDGSRVFAYGMGNNGQPILVVISTDTNKVLSYLNLGTAGVVYNTGTVSTSSTTVTGSGTTWTGISTTFPLQMGFKSTNPQTINTSYAWFPVSSVNSNTSITLASAPSPALSSGTSYVITSLLYASLTFDPSGSFLYVGQLGGKLFVVNIDTLFYMEVGAGNTIANPTSAALPYASTNQALAISSTGIYFSSGSTISVCYGIGKIGTVSSTYNTGTVTASGTTITGSGTSWLSLPFTAYQIGFGSSNPLYAFGVNLYSISSVNSDTSITLSGTPSESFPAGTPYVIFAGTMSFKDQGTPGNYSYPPQNPASSIYLSSTSPSVQLLDCTNGNISVWLPDATGCAGKEFIFPRTDSTNNVAKIYPINGSQDVGGLLTWVIYNKANQVYLKSDGITWKWVNRPSASQWGIAQLPPKKTRNCHDWQNTQMVVLSNDQQLYSWGYDGYGNLAHSTTSNYDLSQPVHFDPINPPTKGTYIVDWVNTGCNLFVLMSDGSVYAAGQNTDGQLGIGNTTPNSYLQKMTSMSQNFGGIVKIWAYSLGTSSSSFGFVYLMRADGTVYVCGYNSTLSLLGNGTASNVLTPSNTGIGIVHPTDLKFGLGSSSSASYQQACCCDAYGKLWFTGQNAFGNFGNGNNTNVTTWTNVTISGVNYIAYVFPGGGYDSTTGGVAYTAVLDVLGNVYTCGDDTFGELGLGSGATNPTKTFTKVTIITNPVGKICWGGGYAASGYALDIYGYLWTWGYNGNNNLFLGNTTTPQYLPNMVMSNVQFIDQQLYTGGAGATGIGVSYDGNSLRISNTSSSTYSLGFGVTDPDYPSAVTALSLPNGVATGEEKVIDLGIFNYQNNVMVFLLTDQGNLYGCGNNTGAILQCGYANYNGSNTSPTGFLKLKVT